VVLRLAIIAKSLKFIELRKILVDLLNKKYGRFCRIETDKKGKFFAIHSGEVVWCLKFIY